MDRLNGHAIQIRQSDADHTYVSDDSGQSWPCWGRSSGGRQISTGPGSSAQANCLSQTDSHAGILYGLTGVCHQTANRILYPARVIVSEAGGYWVSTLLYGTFGTSTLPSLVEWQARKARCGLPGGRTTPASPGPRPSGSQPRSGGPSSSPREARKARAPSSKAYVRSINAIHLQHLRGIRLDLLGSPAGGNFLEEELKLMMDFRLGRDLRPAKGRRVLTAQAAMTRRKGKLDSSLIARSLAPEQYARELNQLVMECLERCLRVLGSELYERLFDLRPTASLNLLDPEILARHHQTEREFAR